MELEEIKERYDLVTSDIYKQIRNKQIDMIIDKAKNNYEPIEIRGMLKIIALTDQWEEDFLKEKAKR